MRRKRRRSTTISFSNERFLELLRDLTGISPVGDLGRQTPLDLTSLESARGSLLMKELFSKYDDGLPSPEKESNTWKRFHAAELSCQTVNQQISKWEWTKVPFWVLVRARIRETLGRFDWEDCALHFDHGPGASTRLPRSRSYAAYKYSGIPESTSGCAALGSAAISMIPLWKQGVLDSGEGSGDLVKIVPGNRVITVPKNFKTDRTIAIEPEMNMYIQKGIGSVIRKRLKRVGVDLNDQTRNQRAAREGSLTGLLATVDLSMASDTVSRSLVEWLLPPDWGLALEQARSPVGVLPSGELIRYQKFSSMGNGYTFELESLIFWAIAQECARPFNIWEMDESICVYGDDIVIPTQFYDQFCARLIEVGFTPNPDKSYSSGPYRESCGKHYYHGIDITPFYIRKPVRTLDRLFLTHNNTFRWGERTGIDVSSVLTSLKNLAPASWRKPRLPDGYGDGAFIGAVDELVLDSHPHGWECWQVKALARMQSELRDNLPAGQLIASLKTSINTTRTFYHGQFGYGPLLTADFKESRSGLPAREGGYRLITISIPRYPTA